MYPHQATNPELKEKPESQLLWNNWCDEVCVESDYGGLGADACVDGSGTGAVGCICKQGVELVDIYPDGVSPTGAKAPAAAAPGAASPAPVAAVPAAPVDTAVAPVDTAVAPVDTAPAPTAQPATTEVPLAPVAESPAPVPATAVAPPLPTDALDPNDKTDYSKCVSTVEGTTDFWCGLGLGVGFG